MSAKEVTYQVLKKVEDMLRSVSPLYLVSGTGISVLLVNYCIRNFSLGKLMKLTRKLPGIRGLVDQELEKNLTSLRIDVEAQLKGKKYITKLPDKGWKEEEILDEIQDLLDLADFKVETGALSGLFYIFLSQGGDWCTLRSILYLFISRWRLVHSQVYFISFYLKVETGALSGTCHKPEESIVRVITRAYSATAYTNPLNPDAYPGIRKMEAEVVRMTGELFHGGEDMVGTMTSGGTESIILAVLAYRGYARERKGIDKPNLVIPQTGHVGFDKAGHLLGVEVRHVPVNPVTFKPDIKEFRKYIDRNTVMLVGSAPQYPHGILDPILELGELGLELDIPLHVDACLGGFLIVFAADVGLELEPFDFSAPGVTSISADTHKFGYAPKVFVSTPGVTSISADTHKFGYAPKVFVSTPGVTSISAVTHKFRYAPKVFVSAPGVTSISADTQKFGYAPKGSSVIMYSSKEYIHFQYYIQPDWSGGIFVSPTLAGSRSGGIIAATWAALMHHGQVGFQDQDQDQSSGWLISCMQYPTAVHLYVVPSHTKPGVAEKFISDLKTCVRKVQENPDRLTGRAAVYGMAQKIPDRSLVADLGANFLDILYSTKPGV
ncbi:sphingosine-1-phosphate lyase [Eurytemora carolleeae]|uniref:sphingosine-1-phosphate lyase n=1 Tax=Eurytemora carolleeae TaxID=1294199 RepID=UPI000C763013|nr:sphingosine-1-phosphate lyase [Eurytemora carolleeae]|eukprot:XP_023332343.1 sphingosine-1-phosphate lyase-like [Eurytemora affinis]